MSLGSIDRLVALGASDAAALRARFTEAGFDPRSIGRGEAVAPGLFDHLRLPLVHAALDRADTPGTDLALLFAYDGTLPRPRFERAMGPRLAALAWDLGLVVETDDGGVRSPFLLMPFQELWVLSDPLLRDADAAMGPGPTTDLLARMLPEVSPHRVLDVGCGAGTLALVAAARGAAEAVGVDINARAIALSRFNAALNGVTAEFHVGDLLAPVAGRRFDLVLSQPPYVALPPAQRGDVFLHGGAWGDELALRLLGQVPSHLADGGRALVLLDSPVRPDAPLHGRVRAALGDAPVDLAVFSADGLSPDLTSIGYTVGATSGSGDYAERVLRHREHLRSLGVEAFSRAVVLLLAPGGRFTMTLPVASMREIDAATLDRWITAVDLASSSDAALQRATVRPAPGLVFVEERPSPDRSVEPSMLVRGRGLAATRELTEATWTLFEALCTAPTVGAGVDVWAEICGATPTEVRGQVLGFVREQLARSLLVSAAAV